MLLSWIEIETQKRVFDNGQPKKKPAYDAEKILKELMAAIAESYEETGEIKPKIPTYYTQVIL